jgi:hypothetical protein
MDQLPYGPERIDHPGIEIGEQTNEYDQGNMDRDHNDEGTSSHKVKDENGAEDKKDGYDRVETTHHKKSHGEYHVCKKDNSDPFSNGKEMESVAEIHQEQYDDAYEYQKEVQNNAGAENEIDNDTNGTQDKADDQDYVEQTGIEGKLFILRQSENELPYPCWQQGSACSLLIHHLSPPTCFGLRTF